MTTGEAALDEGLLPRARRSLLATLDHAAGPFDGARRRLLAAALATPLRVVLRDRDRRIAALSTIGVLSALTLSTVCPAVLFALTPLVLGVPHVASDVRYLVVRRRLPRWWTVSVLVACALMFLLRVAQHIHQGNELIRAEVSLGTAWLAAAAFAGALVAGSWRRLVRTLPVVAIVGVLAQLSPYGSVLVLAHVHNVVALVLWLWLFRRWTRPVWLPLSLIVGATALLASGAATPVIQRIGGDRAFGVELASVSSWLVPGVAPRMALALTLTYVFLQAIHYCVWLGWVPQEDVRAEGTLTFRMSARSLVADFGVLGLLAIGLASALVLGLAAFDALRTREVYLSVAAFHGYLELAMLAYLITAGGASAEPAPAMPAAFALR